MKRDFEVVRVFLRLVKINSETGNEKKVADFIIDYLKNIKIKAKQDKIGNVIAKTKGRGEPIILSAHMDTVSPGKNIKPIIKNSVIRSDGRTILGADDKAGVAGILLAVKNLRKQKNVRPLELIFTVQEEIGCVGARNLVFENLKSKRAVIIDSSSRCGFITCGAPYIQSFLGKIIGKMAHSRAPEEGVNSINCFAEFIKMWKPGRISKYCVSNIGVVSGGRGGNVICDEINFVGEIRAIDKNIFKKQIGILEKKLKNCCKKFSAKYELKKMQEVVGYDYKKDSTLVETISKGIRRSGLKVAYEKRMGATDANVFCEKGIESLSIGYGREKCHSVKEKIKIADLVNIVRIIENIVKN